MHFSFDVSGTPSRAWSGRGCCQPAREPHGNDAGRSAGRLQRNPGAPNYLENKVRDPDTGKEYVLIFARSMGQTPHELRMAAEERLETAQADVHREVTQALLTLQGTPGEGSYAEGVRAALDTVRQLNFAHIN